MWNRPPWIAGSIRVADDRPQAQKYTVGAMRSKHDYEKCLLDPDPK